MINKSAAPLMTGCLLAALSFAVAAQEVKPVKIGVVTFLSGAAAGPFGIPAKNAADLIVEAINAGHGAGAVRRPRASAAADRARAHRRGGRHRQAGDRVSATWCSARTSTSVDRLHLLRRLPRHRAGGRGAEEAHHLLRLRHAAHLRGRELQVRVPHRRAPRRWTPSPPRCTWPRTSPASRNSPASTRTTPGARTPGTTSSRR